MPLQPPSDMNDVELELYQYLLTGRILPVSTKEIYIALKDSELMFITAFVWGLGNTVLRCEEVLGISHNKMYKKINTIRSILKKKYNIKLKDI